MNKIFDVHAHYTDPRYAEEYPGGAEALLDKIIPSPVGYIINASTDMDNAEEVLAQVRRREGMYAAVGIHPGNIRAEMVLDDEMERLRQLLRAAKENKIVALGEIGYDYYWEPYDKETQLRFFEAQMKLAAEYNIPVQIHNRDAHEDCLKMIRRYPEVSGLFHSFSGSPEMARELVRRGWYISFSGVLTFKNARRAAESVAAVPLERITLESDCPYLAPHPHRGKLNHSALIQLVAERLGEILGISAERVIFETTKNAARLFSIDLV